MTDRIRFITHQGKQILLVDLSNCSTAEVEKIIRSSRSCDHAPPRPAHPDKQRDVDQGLSWDELI